MARKRKSTAEKVRQKKEKALPADTAQCAKTTDLFKQSEGEDEDSGREAEKSRRSKQGAGALLYLYDMC